MAGSPPVAVALLVLAATAAAAQRDGRAADSLLALGRLASAESAYYADARVRPRDPGARWRLGRYLALRNATRVGAVLLEEARDFGGDSVQIGRDLAPLYTRLGDWKALAGVAAWSLTPVERRRVEWLVAHKPRTELPERGTEISLRSAARSVVGSPGIGATLVRVGRTELVAVIDPAVVGLRLPAVMRADLVTFDSVTAVATVRLGALTVEHVLTTLVPAGDDARIGFDVIAPFSPTFDVAGGTITLHSIDRRFRPAPGTRVPALHDQRGVWLLFAGVWQPTTMPNVLRLLSSRRWTWDARRGDVVLLTP